MELPKVVLVLAVTLFVASGLGIVGARRLMDEFDLVSEVGKGTTVTVTLPRDRVIEAAAATVAAA